MTVTDYFVLATSNASMVKRFKAVGYTPIVDKKQTIKETVGGISVTEGPVTKYHNMVLRVPAESSDSNYGTRADLEYMYGLNNPNGTPSSRLTYIDHYGLEWYVKLVGRLSAENMTTMLDGSNAAFLIPISILIIEETPS